MCTYFTQGKPVLDQLSDCSDELNGVTLRLFDLQDCTRWRAVEFRRGFGHGSVLFLPRQIVNSVVVQGGQRELILKEKFHRYKRLATFHGGNYHVQTATLEANVPFQVQLLIDARVEV